MHLLNIVIVLILNPSQYITIVRQDTYYCGYEQTCLNEKIDDERLENTCCQPCECEDVCKERGTCCADKEGRNITDKVVKQQCLPASVAPKNIVLSTVQWYNARTRCPATFTDSAIKDKCERDTYKSLEEVIFASSEDGTNVYKNTFCGICHGEKRTLPWTVIMKRSCFRLFVKEDITEANLNDILLTRCELIFVRPNVLNLASLCFNTVVNQCNKTGLWDNYDKRLESLCLHPPENVHYFDNKQLVYSNLYCYLCNSRANVDTRTCQLNKIDRFPNSNQHSLIDLTRWFEIADPSRNEAVQSGRCKRNQVLDSFFDTCRKLYCPKLSLPIDGQCVPFVDGFSFLLTLRLIPNQRLNKTEAVKTGLKSQYIGIIRQVGFGKCGLCSSFMFLQKNTEELELVYIHFSVTTKVLCKAEAIWAALIEIERASFNVELLLNQIIILFDVVLDYEFQQDVNRFEKILQVGSSGACRTIGWERRSYCPKVKLTMEEYRTVLSHYNNTDKLLFIPSNDSMYVCCDKYIVDLRTSGGNEQVPAISVVIMFLVAHSTGHF